ncbi:MAG TPA: SCP2 sterol-binding domain-containing protein [Alphaproteobacteria bacterium]|nr:SCP2 sterol-binding domain-containing protein [Alphaproteobacteria bacterium]HRK98366.1 SCP2 sterol-binding domain-containing protein [Alphaproteobacteria bacterium]
MISFITQLFLGKIVRYISQTRPDIFNRMEAHTDKVFLIDPVNLPLVLILKPQKENPSLTACPRHKILKYDARISGTFLTLLKMIDGQLDGDALFFTRDLTIEGDTEAVVCLRNALDDVDGSVVEDVATLFPLLGTPTLSFLRNIKN